MQAKDQLSFSIKIVLLKITDKIDLGKDHTITFQKFTIILTLTFKVMLSNLLPQIENTKQEFQTITKMSKL
jgi:hypothetical protein